MKAKARQLFFLGFIIGGILLPSSPALAEYRVFNLRITNTQTQDFRMVLSTLDPHQYGRYYPVQANEVLSYTETWRCFGRTDDFQPYCPNPKAQSPAASANP